METQKNANQVQPVELSPERNGLSVRQPGLLGDCHSAFQAYERLPVAIAQCAVATGSFLHINQRGCEIFGYPREIIVAHTLGEIIHPDDRPDYEEAVRWLCSGETNSFTLDCRCYRAHGPSILANLTLLSQGGEGETPSAFLVVVSDVTTAKREEEERGTISLGMAKAQRLEALGTLAGGVAHDFNNILTTIIGYTELVADGLPEKSLAQENLEVIRSSAWRACNLVRSLLTFSRQASDELIAIPLASAVKEVLKMIRATIPTSITIVAAIDDVGTVMAGSVHVQQILMNLCTNAYHAMRDGGGGRLEVGLQRLRLPNGDPAIQLPAGLYARLLVSDTGVGIDRVTIEHIFEPFFTTKQAREGTGLGLSVVHGLVKQLGGAIQVESEPGQGARFTLYFPLVEAVPRAMAIDSRPVRLPGGSERILIVDDEPMIADLVQQMLSQVGYRTMAVSSSLQALSLIQEGRFDLLITDQGMPEMTGSELIRKVSVPNGVKTILCTGYSEQVDERGAQAIGASAFFMKPYVMAELVRKVREVLDGKQANPVTPPNCWEFMQCQLEAGGQKAVEFGVCPAYPDHGRCCAKIAGTLCGGSLQESPAQKKGICPSCDYYRSRYYDHDRGNGSPWC